MLSQKNAYLTNRKLIKWWMDFWSRNHSQLTRHQTFLINSTLIFNVEKSDISTVRWINQRIYVLTTQLNYNINSHNLTFSMKILMITIVCCLHVWQHKLANFHIFHLHILCIQVIFRLNQLIFTMKFSSHCITSFSYANFLEILLKRFSRFSKQLLALQFPHLDSLAT